MVKFGSSGTGEGISAQALGSYIREKRLDAFEYSFGRGYHISSQLAEKAGEEFAANNIAVSLHAPFYINFANPDEIMHQKSRGYLQTGIKFMRAFGADHLVFHAASQGKLPREQAIALTTERLESFLAQLEEEGALEGIFLCPETMGKPMQIGSYEEIIQLCKVNKHLTPTFDFGHINALSGGGLKTADDYKKILGLCIENLGLERTNNSHIHFSKIQYGAKGEIRHLNYEEDDFYGPNFEPLAEVLVEWDICPRVICESASNMVRDAQIMQKIYLNTRQKASSMV